MRIEMRDISKAFGSNQVLEKIDLVIESGQVHALMGENGAGKSTLIKVLTGVEEFHDGEIKIDGITGTVINHSPQEAQENGISTVYQEINLCHNLTVAENIFVGREIKKFGMVDWKKTNQRAREILENFSIHIDVTKPLGEFSVAMQQMVAIARAVDISAKILILDEPTIGLDIIAKQKLREIINEINSTEKTTIFLTSHDL